MLVTARVLLLFESLWAARAEPDPEYTQPGKAPAMLQGNAGVHTLEVDDEAKQNIKSCSAPAMLQASAGVQQQAHLDEFMESTSCEKTLNVTLKSASYDIPGSHPRTFFISIAPWNRGGYSKDLYLNSWKGLSARSAQIKYVETDRLWLRAYVSTDTEVLHVLGEADIDSSTFSTPSGFEGKIELWNYSANFEHRNKTNNTVTVKINPSWLSIKVKVKSAYNLPSKDAFGGKPDAFVWIGSGCEHAQTRVVEDNYNPHWDQSFDLKWQVGTSLHFVVWDKDSWSQDDWIGDVKLQASEFDTGAVLDKKLSLSEGDALLDAEVALAKPAH